MEFFDHVMPSWWFLVYILKHTHKSQVIEQESTE